MECGEGCNSVFVKPLAKGFRQPLRNVEMGLGHQASWSGTSSENPNQRKAAAKLALAVPDGCVLEARVHAGLRPIRWVSSRLSSYQPSWNP
jgi:hypothetical protein